MRTLPLFPLSLRELLCFLIVLQQLQRTTFLAICHGAGWPLCADVPLNPHSLIHSLILLLRLLHTVVPWPAGGWATIFFFISARASSSDASFLSFLYLGETSFSNFSNCWKLISLKKKSNSQRARMKTR